MFEPRNQVVADLMRNRIENGPCAGHQANRLYAREISEVEERGFRVLDYYLARLAEDGFDAAPDCRPLYVRVTRGKATHSLKVRERLSNEVDENGKRSLARTGNLCVEIDRIVSVKEPDNDLIQSYPRVLQAVKREPVDQDLLRDMYLERAAKRKFESLLAPGPRSYEERVRDTIKQFQKMALNYDETRRVRELLQLLKSTATEPDAATIEILNEYMRIIDPLAHGGDVALRTLTYVLHGPPEDEPSRLDRP
ncbi:hypothetical protein B5M44_21455 [Shinella sumterensis]|uniref:hypothetical protein n=1 Tax=Shinella sumterensis TaxID=1967501 RepID=UPI00106E1AEC|nr:hypothetical protein [Shinella sumterensis]MCD1266858.1 hypothetical protein [Shinella sumterensis]TFE95284.1 hypothetical protein B5M44_21455 [Shinella sumterensis]